MRHSSTRYIGLDVHKASMAVAYVAKEHDAEVIYLGTIGTRQVDIDQLIRKMQSKAKHLVFVYEAGPCGYWLRLFRWTTQRNGNKACRHKKLRKPLDIGSHLNAHAQRRGRNHS